jgi:H+/Cl- antiporter ClcA
MEERADAPLYSTQYRAANRSTIASRAHHNPYSLEDDEEAKRRMHSYSALDYEEPSSDVHTLATLRQTKGEQSSFVFWNWATFWGVGVTVGVLAYLIKEAVAALTSLKYRAVNQLLTDPSVDRSAAFGAFLGISVAYGLISSLLIVYVEKTAAGSGIPEVKAFLNGTNTPRFLTPLAGLVKVVGIAFSVSSGLIIGREGPLIHIGAIVGNLLSTRPGAPKAWKRFRSDRHKRDFVSAGAAAGVAGAFSSPVGGICFAFEEASSFWRLSLTWRTFLCTMLTTSTQWIISAVVAGDSSFWGYLKYGAFDNKSLFRIWEIPLLASLGFVGGLAGALFCGANAKLSIWRLTNVAPYKWRRVLEVVLIVGTTASFAFWLPFAMDTCAEAPTDIQCHKTWVAQVTNAGQHCDKMCARSGGASRRPRPCPPFAHPPPAPLRRVTPLGPSARSAPLGSSAPPRSQIEQRRPRSLLLCGGHGCGRQRHECNLHRRRCLRRPRLPAWRVQHDGNHHLSASRRRRPCLLPRPRTLR